jgi:UDP-N-acetylmuramoylalanine--D-glutamate ligase
MKLIIGLGKTGLSFVRYCLKRELDFAVVDTRPNPPGIEALKALVPDCRQCFGEIPYNLIDQASELFISPGVPLQIPAIRYAMKQGKLLTGDVELFARAQKDIPVIAITGSNAKSTVTVLVGEMLNSVGKKAMIAGNIGLPVLDVLDESPDVFVLELSSFQLETTRSLKAKSAAVLNVCEDHMDRYANFSDYLAAKQRVYHDAECAVESRDDALTRSTFLGAKKLNFGLSSSLKKHEFGVIVETEKRYLARGNQKIMGVDAMKLQGRHHELNALAALALASCVFPDVQQLAKVLPHFSGLPHRCQLVDVINGVAWVNDSKATNVGATVAAVQGLATGKNIILLVGGQSKEADLSGLLPVFQSCVKQLFIFGEDADKFEKLAADSVAYQKVNDLEAAMSGAKTAAEKGDIVLLSPACASFDMFDNFEARGDCFLDWVRKQ